MQCKRATEALFCGGAVLDRLLAHTAVVPDFRRRLGCTGDEMIVYLERFAVALLHEQQMRQIGERRDLAWPSREHVTIAALGTTRLADRIELQTQVVEQARIPGRKLKRSLENRDRGGCGEWEERNEEASIEPRSRRHTSPHQISE